MTSSAHDARARYDHMTDTPHFSPAELVLPAPGSLCSQGLGE